MERTTQYTARKNTCAWGAVALPRLALDRLPRKRYGMGNVGAVGRGEQAIIDTVYVRGELTSAVPRGVTE